MSAFANAAPIGCMIRCRIRRFSSLCLGTINLLSRQLSWHRLSLQEMFSEHAISRDQSAWVQSHGTRVSPRGGAPCF
jgi:hypothetical protein